MLEPNGRLDRIEKRVDDIRVEMLEEAVMRAKWRGEHDNRAEQQDKTNGDVEARLRALERLSYKALGLGAAILFISNIIALALFRHVFSGGG